MTTPQSIQTTTSDCFDFKNPLSTIEGFLQEDSFQSSLQKKDRELFQALDAIEGALMSHSINTALTQDFGEKSSLH